MCPSRAHRQTRAMNTMRTSKENTSRASIMAKGDLVAGGHCMRPGFLSDQIERSRKNLGVDRIDVFYLHNPEQQLDSLDRNTFATLMHAAFAELETQVAAGHIGVYGCATWNGFRVPPAARNHLSLPDSDRDCEESGRKIASFPVRAAAGEPGHDRSSSLANQTSNGSSFSLLDLARQMDISVVASASLMQSQLTHNLPPGVQSLFPDLAYRRSASYRFRQVTPCCRSARWDAVACSSRRKHRGGKRCHSSLRSRMSRVFRSITAIRCALVSAT